MNKELLEKSWIERFTSLFSHEKKTQADLVALLQEFSKDQVVEADTLAIMFGAMQVSEMRVADIMVPKSQMITLLESDSLMQVLAKIHESGHSRYPVMDEKNDHVLGVLLAKDLLPLIGQPLTEFHCADFIRSIDVVPDSMRLDILFQRFRRRHQHLAIIVDEYGEWVGLATIEDVLEQIVGNIDDEYDVDDESYVNVQENGQINVKARMPLRDFNEYFNVNLATEQGSSISGYLLSQVHYLPKQGEVITADGFEFTILNVNHRRIKLIAVKRF